MAQKRRDPDEARQLNLLADAAATDRRAIYQHSKRCEELQRQLVMDLWPDLRAVEAKSTWEAARAEADRRCKQKPFDWPSLPFQLDDWRLLGHDVLPPHILDWQVKILSIDHAERLIPFIVRYYAGRSSRNSGRKNRKKGRIPSTDPEKDKRIAEAWATRRYQRHEDLDRQMELPRGEVKRALDRHRKRRKKGGTG